MSNVDRSPYFSLGALIGYLLLIIIGLNILVAIPVMLDILPQILKNPHAGFELPVDKLLLANIAWQILAILVLFLLFKSKEIFIPAYFDFHKPLTVKNILSVALIFIVIAAIITPLSDYFDIPPNPLMADLMEKGNFLLIVTTAVILAPIVEESLFRGFLFNELESRYNSFVALHISSIAFTLIHIQYGLAELSFLLIIAYTLGLIRLRYKNLIYPMIFHFINNLAALIEFYYFT